MPNQNALEGFDLIVNRDRKEWPTQFISGSDVRILAGSPPDWVVNQIVAGPGEDPDVTNETAIDLDHKAEPNGIKRFTTRKPSTNPG
jgi:hypothetical protein